MRKTVDRVIAGPPPGIVTLNAQADRRLVVV